MTSKQETFNRAYRGLAAQGFEKSVDMSGECAYRSSCGTKKCAAGHLIPDEDYSEAMERIGVWASEVWAPLKRDGHALDLVTDLQSAHDESTSPLNMQYRLAIVANAHGLTIPKIG